jgi:hypothetical protein
MNFGVKSVLASAEKIRNKYERSGKAVDAELRGKFPPPPPKAILNEEQSRIARSCLGLEAGATTVTGVVEWVKLKSSSPFVSMSMKYTTPKGNEPRYARATHPKHP